MYDTRSGRAKRVFCTDTFRLTIRQWRAHDVYSTTDDVTTPYESLFVIVWFRNIFIAVRTNNCPRERMIVCANE